MISCRSAERTIACVVRCCLGWLLACGLPSLLAADDGVFKAGAAVKEFTAPAGTVMPNFPLRVEDQRVARVAEGTHDPLMVKTVVLEEGETLLSLTSYDVVDAFDSVTSRVRNLVAAELPIQPQNILLSATHTHQGPVLKPGGKDRWGHPVDPELFESAVQAVFATIIEAYRQREPASIGAGRGFIELSRNRRFIHRDGQVTSIPKRLPQRRYYGPVDHEVGLVRLEDLEGSPIAVLVNYTAHPTIMRHKYRLYSAEFPGAMARHVAAGLERDVPVLFFNGAEGNIAPIYDGADDWDVMEQMGKELAAEVVRVYLTVAMDTQPKLKIVHRDVPLDAGNEDPERAARLHMIFFGDTAIATVGGELFVEIALEFKRRCLFPHTMVFGLTDGDLWYIPHRGAYDYGGYGVSSGPNGPLADSFMQQQSRLGERLLETWLEMMYEQAETRPR